MASNVPAGSRRSRIASESPTPSRCSSQECAMGLWIQPPSARTSESSKDETGLGKPTSLPLDGHARGTQSPANAVDSQTHEADSGGKSSDSLETSALNGSLGRMCPDFSLSEVARISERCSLTWTTSGMAWRGGCWTLNTSEWPNAAAACSLSDVLEDLYPYECYSTEKMPQWFSGELERRTYGHHVSFHFRSGLRASSTEISRFLSRNARVHIRVLTVKECERLQGFPDEWTLADIADAGTLSAPTSSSGLEDEF